MSLARKSVRNLIQDEVGVMRDMLANFLNLLIVESDNSSCWKSQFNSLCERKLTGSHLETYRDAKAALDANNDEFSTEKMDITLLTALLTFDMSSTDSTWLPGVQIRPSLRFCVTTLRNDKNNYLSHETDSSNWESLTHAVTCLTDMRRYLKCVEKEYGAQSQYRDYLRRWGQAIDELTSTCNKVYDDVLLSNAHDAELRDIAYSIVSSPDPTTAYFDESERILTRRYTNTARNLEDHQKLLCILYRMKFPIARTALAHYYVDGLYRDEEHLAPDYSTAVRLLTESSLTELDKYDLNTLVQIIAHPSTRPKEYDTGHAKELFDKCLEIARNKQWTEKGWKSTDFEA